MRYPIRPDAVWVTPVLCDWFSGRGRIRQPSEMRVPLAGLDQNVGLIAAEECGLGGWITLKPPVGSQSAFLQLLPLPWWGGEEGDKTLIFSKEDADHSLPYLIAVALLDHTMMPAQFAPRWLLRADVQALLCRVSVRPLAAYSKRFPDEMPSRVTVTVTASLWERVLT